MAYLWASGRRPTTNLDTPVSTHVGQMRKLWRLVTASVVAAVICASVNEVHFGSRRVVKSWAVAPVSASSPPATAEMRLECLPAGWLLTISCALAPAVAKIIAVSSKHVFI